MMVSRLPLASHEDAVRYPLFGTRRWLSEGESRTVVFGAMKTTTALAPIETPAPAPHRYQIFRQSKNGVHHNYGSSITAPEEAVEIFLETPPLYEGGGIRLWDHREQRAVAATEWIVETTQFGFPVRARANAFFDDSIARIAQHVIEREAFFQSVAQRIGLAS
jgi:hypothetical protein